MPLDANAIAILIGGVGVLITAIGTSVVQIIVALRTQRAIAANTDITKETVRVAAGAAADTAVILGHVNSEATQLKAVIAAQVKQIEDMRQQLEKSERRALMLAQARAQGAPDPAASTS